jgi:hypothetical protein
METKNTYKFDEMEPKLPFTVPENYFEDFAARMEEQLTPRSVTVKRMMKPWLYMAAMFVGLLVIGNILLQVHRTNTLEQDEQYEAYVLSQLDQSLYYEYYFDEVGLKEESGNSHDKK